MNFPNRSTDCGKLINAFLTKQQDFDHETIHLLFSMNRWESKKQMERLLNEGTSLIIDRYSFSGVAYSAAKGIFCIRFDFWFLKASGMTIFEL